MSAHDYWMLGLGFILGIAVSVWSVGRRIDPSIREHLKTRDKK